MIKAKICALIIPQSISHTKIKWRDRAIYYLQWVRLVAHFSDLRHIT